MLPSLRRSRRHNRAVRNSSRRLLVESLESRRLLTVYNVTSLSGDNSTNTLGWAIEQSDANGPGPNAITFGISGTITLTAALPAITVPVDINATTLAGYAGTPLVQVVGSGSLGNGLTVSAPNVTIEGLTISGFSGGAGISINSPNNTAGNGDTVTSCFLGTNAGGTSAQANLDGIDIVGSSYNTVNVTTYISGGNTVAAYNVISGNTGQGVSITPSASGTDATHNVISGSNIGTDRTGTVAIANGLNGVQINSVSNNTIGGLAPATGLDKVRNVISGNTVNGINFADTSAGAQDNLVEDSLIGLDATGTTPIANGSASGGYGVYMLQPLVGNAISGNTIGGTSPNAKNVISGNLNGGVIFNGATGNTVDGDYIGTNANGNAAEKNGGFGVYVFNATNNTIGGTVLGAGNVIAGNGLAGIYLFASGATNDSGTLIAGNDIGLGAGGTAEIPNQSDGITSLSPGVTIGGTTSAARNVISGNKGNGISLDDGNGGLIEGNYIGTDFTGETALPNTGDGVYFNGAGRVTIGGAAPADRNVISGNLGDGIHFDSSTGSNLIEGNYIGIDAEDTFTEGFTLGNGGAGITITNSTGDTIGGTTADAANVIGGNSSHGIATGDGSSVATNTLIEGNYIGTDSNGANFGNLGDGVHLFSTLNTVGGVTAAAGNTIENNGGAGVQIVLNANQNTILSNSIYGNSGHGISLVAGSVPTPNHPDEAGASPGPNDFQNYPVLDTAITDGVSETTINGSLNSNANTTYLIQFFASPTADPTGYGQGAVLIGSTTVTTDATGNATISNLVLSTGTNVVAGDSISATATDESGANTKGDTSEFAEDVMAQGTADVSLNNPPPTVSPSGAVYVGQDVTYTFTVTNLGPDDARGVVFSDDLPIGATYLSSTAPASAIITVSGSVLTVDLGDLPPPSTGSTANMATITITVVPTVPATESSPLTDTASVGTIDDDPNLLNNDATLTTTVNAVIPVALSMSSTPNPVLVGQDLVYTIAVTNESNAAATNVVVTDTLDPNETFLSASVTPSALGAVGDVGQVVTADIPTLGANQTAYVTVTVTPTAAAATLGSVTESASVNYDQAVSDPNPAEHSATITTNVSPAVDLSVTFLPVPTPNPVYVGQDVTYTVVVANIGPSTASNVQFTDEIDPNSTFISGTWNTSPTVALNPPVAGLLTQNIGSLASGASTSFTIVVAPTTQAISAITDKGTISNTASVTETETDLNPANNTATVLVNVLPLVQLSFGTPLVNGVAATPSGPAGSYISPAVSAGQTFSYTFSVTNAGPSTANNVILTDTLPTGLTYVSASSTQGVPPSQNGGIVTANLGSLIVGATASVTIDVSATGSVSSVSNSPSVSANESEAATPVNPVVTTPVNPAVSLAVTDVGSPNPLVVNQPLTYTIKVTNNGPSTATDVSVTDTLDPNVTFVSGVTNQGTHVSPLGGVLTADLGTLGVGGTATLTVVVTPTLAGTVMNQATVTNTPELVTDAPVTASASTTVLPSADLQVALTGNPSTVTTGNNLTYNATVLNNGPSGATNVVLTDTLPAGVTVVSVIGSAGGSVIQTGNVVTGNFSSLADGATASVSIVVTPTVTGTITDQLSATSDQIDPNPNNSQTSVNNTVVQPPGSLEFSAGLFTANDTDGVATITVVRTGGDQGAVSVHYATTNGSATPGVNYLPTSGTLVFPQGATTETFTVPVLVNPYAKQDSVVGLEIDTASGGALLGQQTSATLDIHVTNPDVTPPAVNSVTWFGPGATITDIVITFSKEVNIAAATNVNNYNVVDTGKGGVYGDANNVPVALSGAYYDAATDSVTLTTAYPLKTNEFYHIDINGSKPGAIADGADNLLAGNGAAGTDYQSYFGRGTKLSYVDASGNSVTLRLTGGGVLDVSRYADGEGDNLNVVSPKIHRTTLSGSVKGGTTSFNTMTGLGNFGDVRVLLRTPPFYVANFPYVGNKALSAEAVDQVLGSADLNAPVSATVVVKPKVAKHHR